jgi:hypothetical protein
MSLHNLIAEFKDVLPASGWLLVSSCPLSQFWWDVDEFDVPSFPQYFIFLKSLSLEAPNIPSGVQGVPSGLGKNPDFPQYTMDI